MTGPDQGRRPGLALPIAAILVLVGFLALTFATAGDTLGFDFLAYHAAAVRVLHGGSPYDLTFEEVGGFGLFFYPPSFVTFVLPFGLLEPGFATWLWIGLLIVAFGVGVALMPVAASTRWLMVLLGGLSWPLIFAVKLGQVTPLLFLGFAVGWRWLRQSEAVGLAAAFGAAWKLQPGLLFVWALLTGRWRAILVGGAALVAIAGVATLLFGVTAWSDFWVLMRQLDDPLQAERNMSPGSALFKLGLPTDTARAAQLISSFVVLSLLVIAAARATAEASYLMAVLASQLISPILWDHYAMLLLLPTAYLVARRQRWAIVVPLLTTTLLVTVMPPIAYPAAFYVALIATLVVGMRERSQAPRLGPSFA